MSLHVIACSWRPKRSTESRRRLPVFNCPVGSLIHGFSSVEFWMDLDLDGIAMHCIDGFHWILMDCDFFLGWKDILALQDASTDGTAEAFSPSNS